MLTKPKPATDPIEVYNAETCECVLSEDYKRAIREAMPPGIEPLDSFWDVLTDIVSKFKIMEKCRTNQRRAVVEIKHWQKIAKLVAKCHPADDNQDTVKTIAEGKVASYRTVIGNYKGKSNQANEALYMWVIEDLWCQGLGQELGVSSVEKEVPGPLIRFFIACVNPLLPQPLKASGIAEIHDRAKARRKRLEILNRKLELKAKRLKLIRNWRERTKDQT
jgi:hypothetical protein